VVLVLSILNQRPMVSGLSTPARRFETERSKHKRRERSKETIGQECVLLVRQCAPQSQFSAGVVEPCSYWTVVRRILFPFQSGGKSIDGIHHHQTQPQLRNLTHLVPYHQCPLSAGSSCHWQAIAKTYFYVESLVLRHSLSLSLLITRVVTTYSLPSCKVLNSF
jgi:hypothetical protein